MPKEIEKEQIDRETLNKLLKEYDGKVSHVVHLLKGSPYECTAQEIIDFVREDFVLNPIWYDKIMGKRFKASDGPNLAEIATRTNPIDESRKMNEAINMQDEYIAGVGLEKCGLKPDTVSKMLSYAQFVGKSFTKMVDMTHGMMIVSAINLKERIDYIENEILLNNEIVTKDIVDKDGGVTRIKAPKYSDEAKLAWQKEYANLVDMLRKISDSATNTQLVGEKIANLANEQVNAVKGGKSKGKLARSPKNVSHNQPIDV